MAEEGYSGLFDGESGKSRRDLNKHKVPNRITAAAPYSVLTPNFVGEVVLDTANHMLWRAASSANTGWVAYSPATTNAIVLGAGNNNIGDIDVLSVIPGTAATNLGKAVDSAVGATDTGIAALAQRVDALVTLTPAVNDYARLYVDKWGRLHVRESLDEYETVAAAQTGQVIGATGAAGDILKGLLIVPASLSPGNVIIIDNATSITVFAGGANSVLSLHSFFIPLGLRSVSGAWGVTTGANVSVIAIGDFT